MTATSRDVLKLQIWLLNVGSIYQKHYQILMKGQIFSYLRRIRTEILLYHQSFNLTIALRCVSNTKLPRENVK